MNDISIEQLLDLLAEAVRESDHAPGCARRDFMVKNRYLPAKHPVWKHPPECDCWRGRAEALLKQ